MWTSPHAPRRPLEDDFKHHTAREQEVVDRMVLLLTLGDEELTELLDELTHVSSFFVGWILKVRKPHFQNPANKLYSHFAFRAQNVAQGLISTGLTRIWPLSKFELPNISAKKQRHITHPWGLILF